MITKEQRDAIEALPNWEATYTVDDGYDNAEDADEQFEDDCFIHVRRQATRFVYYNGQDKYALTNMDVEKYVEKIDAILKETQ